MPLSTRRVFTLWVAALLALLVAVPGAYAQTEESQDPPFGRTPEQRGHWSGVPGQYVPTAAPKLAAQPTDDDPLPDVEPDPDDASIPLNLVPYHDIAPKLRELRASERISVEVIGQSGEGRDLHLVVATSPMSDGEWNDWQRLSDLRTADPEAAIAAKAAGEYDDWKTPLFINNNIHGNEWEGTDAALQLLDTLAFSDDAEIEELLDTHVIAVVVTMNPDGRVNGTRQNANGFDMNRDFVTQSQQEVRAVRDQLIRYNPVTMIDLHGYVSCTLIEPTTGPHGENYEYDLYIRQAIRNGLSMEAAVLDATTADSPLTTSSSPTACTNSDGSRRADIPWRDRLSGWDDWPPIFTPMYAMYHGAVGHTVEIPLNPRGVSNVTERHRRTRINTVVGKAAMEGNLAYATQERDWLLDDQLELFRRGANGENARPVDDELALSLANSGTFGGTDVDNAETFSDQTYPRAYVIPMGRGQRSDSAAARLVQFLIDNDVQVHRSANAFSLGGVDYAQGSYVVDMHQAKRGLANTILDVGRDVTENFPTMYDISAWSLGSLWGATVNTVDGDNLGDAKLLEVGAAGPTGSVAPGRRARYAIDVDSAADIRAVNWLAEQGVSLSRRADGVVFVPGADVAAAREAAERFGVQFTDVPPARIGDTSPLGRTRLGVSAPSDEVFALRSMGFPVTTVTHTAFNNGTASFSDFDALYVSTTSFNPLNLNATQQAAFAEWLEDGGNVVGRGSSGVTFNSRASLLPVGLTNVTRSDANGIVAVSNNTGSPITGDSVATSFVNAPRYFNEPGDGVRVDQRLDDGDFFLAGHWIGSSAAAGQPVVVSGESRGAQVTLFTTEPLYRSHPEGLFEQVANGLWW